MAEDDKKLKRNKSSKKSKETEEELSLESLAKRLDAVEASNSKLRSKVKALESQNEFFLKLFSNRYSFNPSSSFVRSSSISTSSLHNPTNSTQLSFLPD